MDTITMTTPMLVDTPAEIPAPVINKKNEFLIKLIVVMNNQKPMCAILIFFSWTPDMWSGIKILIGPKM